MFLAHIQRKKFQVLEDRAMEFLLVMFTAGVFAGAIVEILLQVAAEEDV